MQTKTLSKEIWNSLDSLRGVMRANEAMACLLLEAAQLKGGMDLSEQSELIAPTRKGTEGNEILSQAAAKLLKADNRTRLEILDSLMAILSSGMRGYTEMWQPINTAEKLADLTGQHKKIRCVGGIALTSALVCALRGKKVLYRDLSREAIAYCQLFAFILDTQIECRLGAWLESDEDWDAQAEILLHSLGCQIRDKEELPKAISTQIDNHGIKGRLNSDTLSVLDALKSKTTLSIAAVAPSFLYRDVGAEATVRSMLVASEHLQAVLSIPGGTVYPGTMLKPAILIVDKSTKHTSAILFDVDTPSLFQTQRGVGGAFSAELNFMDYIKGSKTPPTNSFVIIKREEIENNDNLLNIERYRLFDEALHYRSMLDRRKTIPLLEICKAVRPAALPRTEDGQLKTVHEAAPRDINERGLLTRPEKTIEVTSHALQKYKTQILQEGDILFSTKGVVGVTGMVPPLPSDETWTAGQAFVILRLNASAPATRIQLYTLLSSNILQAYLKTLVTGNVVQVLGAKSLNQIELPILTTDEAKKIEEEHALKQQLHDEIDKITTKLKQIQSSSVLESI